MSYDDLTNALTEHFGLSRGDLHPDARLVEDLGLDSVAMYELYAAICDLSQTDFEPEVLTEVVTIRDVLEMLTSQS